MSSSSIVYLVLAKQRSGRLHSIPTPIYTALLIRVSYYIMYPDLPALRGGAATADTNEEPNNNPNPTGFWTTVVAFLLYGLGIGAGFVSVIGVICIIIYGAITILKRP